MLYVGLELFRTNIEYNVIDSIFYSGILPNFCFIGKCIIHFIDYLKYLFLKFPRVLHSMKYIVVHIDIQNAMK